MCRTTRTAKCSSRNTRRCRGRSNAAGTLRIRGSRCRKRKRKSSGPSGTRKAVSLLGRRLPKLDVVALGIVQPRKISERGIFGGLIDGDALALEMGEDFGHVLHAVVDLAGARLAFDVVLGAHDGPRGGALDLWIFE